MDYRIEFEDYRIEFEDDGILRECFVDNYYTASALVYALQHKYRHVQLIDSSNECILMSYCVQ